MNNPQPSRVVLAGVGCAHEDLVKLADKYMSGTWGSGAAAPAKAAAVYTGGQSIVEASHDDGLTHVMLGWKAPSWNDSDLVTAAVLNLMMGGGGSFSSGGPGKVRHVFLNSSRCVLLGFLTVVCILLLPGHVLAHVLERVEQVQLDQLRQRSLLAVLGLWLVRFLLPGTGRQDH
jgi:hypothetical protein